MRDALVQCTVTGRRVVERLTTTCAISGERLLRERAATSARSGRMALPTHARTCVWTGQSLLMDEVHECRLTGLVFSSVIDVSWAAEPFVRLVAGGVPGGIPEDHVAGRVRDLLQSVGRSVRGLRIQVSPGGGHVAFLADAGGLFGLRKRHLLGFARFEGEPGLVGRLVEGRCDGQRFVVTG